jgi:hypothetical protein
MNIVDDNNTFISIVGQICYPRAITLVLIVLIKKQTLTPPPPPLALLFSISFTKETPREGEYGYVVEAACDKD